MRGLLEEGDRPQIWSFRAARSIPAFGRAVDRFAAAVFLARMNAGPSGMWLGLAVEVGRASDPTSQMRDVGHPATIRICYFHFRGNREGREKHFSNTKLKYLGTSVSGLVLPQVVEVTAPNAEDLVSAEDPDVAGGVGPADGAVATAWDVAGSRCSLNPIGA